MAQFTKSTPVVRTSGAVSTTGQIPDTRTHEGGAGYARTPESELFLTAVTHLHGKDTFYEGADARAIRLIELTRGVTEANPEFVERFAPWLRHEASIRTAAVVMAAEYVKAGGDNGRKVIGDTLARADEPAELLGYWLSRYGRSIPKALKKGLADAAVKLYDERAILKYDSSRHTVRPADVIALCHPKPKDAHQDAVFTALLDRRHGNTPTDETLELLPRTAADMAGDAQTWERAGADRDWNKLILDGKMGVFATLRNLRNFDQAEISDEAVSTVKNLLTNEDAVRKSRVLPLRFLTAWENVNSMRWATTLEEAIDKSLANIPELGGNTLILLDCSGSMTWGSDHSSVPRYKQAGVFAFSLAKSCEDATVVAYSTEGKVIGFEGGESVLRKVENLWSPNRRFTWIGGGTNTWSVMRSALSEFPGSDRVVIVTDEQTRDSLHLDELDVVLGQRPCHVLNVAGYEPASAPSSRVITFGGFNDRAFEGIRLAEQGLAGVWPWDTDEEQGE